MKKQIAAVSAAALALSMCSCTVKTGSSSPDESSAVDADVSVTMGDEQLPDQVTLPLLKGFKGSSTRGTFDLSWKPVEGAEGYEVFMRSASGAKTENYFVAADWNKYTIVSSKQGDCAFFSVRAYVRKDGVIEYTAQSKEIKLTTMRDKCILTVQNVCQYSKPSLPTGCECSALTSLLRYCGFDVTKNEIAADYLEKIPFTEKKKKGKKGGTVLYGADPNEAFPGDPADEDSYGCYAKPIADAANKYLATQDTDLRAKDLTGSKLYKLYKYINNGTPVVVWATTDLKASKKTDTWLTADGKEITWLHNEHCLVLIGYDEEKGVIYCADPSKRSVLPIKYDAELFEKRYKEQGSHAVVIE